MDGRFCGSSEALEEGELCVSLLTQIMEDCCILNHIRMDDDYGGYTDEWTQGATFKAAIGKKGSPEIVVAEKQGLAEQYTVVVRDTFSLDYHDVFQRLSDGAIFRVTSRTQDSTAHPSSTVRIATVDAERWELPS